MRDGLQIKNHFGLLTFSNPNLLFGKVLESVLGDSHRVVFEFEIRDAQLASLGRLRLKFSVEKDSCLVLTSDNNQCAQVLAGFKKRVKCGRGSCFNIEFVLSGAAGSS